MPKLPALNHLRVKYNLPLLILLQLVFCFLSFNTHGQTLITDKLITQIQAVRSDSERLVRMGELSRLYYANKDFEQGDSVFEKEIMLAESTLKQHLVLHSYFKNISFLVTSNETKKRSAKIMDFVKRALEYAKASDLPDYVALAYSNMAAVHLSSGDVDAAFRYANQAFTTALNTINDSAKVVSAIQLGKVYEERSDVLRAFEVFSNAQNMAIQSGRPSLLPPVFHAMGDLCHKFGKDVEAKRYVNQSLSINKEENNLEGQIIDNISLAKYSNYVAGKDYLNEAVRLADLLNNVPLKIDAEKILFFHMLLEEKPASMLLFLDERPELKYVFTNTGPDYINWMFAEIYLYGGNYDSALYFFKNAEASFNTGYDQSTRKNFFHEFAYCNQLLNNTADAIFYYKKSYDIARASSDQRRLKASSGELRKLYQQQGDYKQAFEYSLLFDQHKDSLDQLGRERDLALREIDNVTRQKKRDEEIAKQKLERQYNLQYMLITIVVALAFLLMIMIGMFKVSAFTIRIMGFLSLIFFFEFIILILDKWIHDLTHGEPWKVWLIKIVLISILLPLHHFLENKIIRYLLSRHLIILRDKLSIARYFRKKKPDPQKETTEEAIIDENLLG